MILCTCKYYFKHRYDLYVLDSVQHHWRPDACFCVPKAGRGRTQVDIRVIVERRSRHVVVGNWHRAVDEIVCRCTQTAACAVF